jgi:hypothetical protein
MNRGALQGPLFIGSFKRPPMKMRQPQKNAKGLIQKTSNEKRGNPRKTQRGSFKRPLMKKEATPEKRKGAHSKDL